ncbi:helix-turn-helix domain-containing protein [Mycolicibacterium vanbaalenii]|uniref:helix-turn-helix domain-containing protein n=1 Tax=Mycolicibacterium vanbaalenii TaxID=110539 RepID=UPI000A06BC1B|nr:helix-turn-helix domain-containing protein [Mycolicibacterium vanbaalenii]MCV7127021.1 helix-turn-helix domain-containing protein [Mycolicibacterium vanbaalenii PYR-1]
MAKKLTLQETGEIFGVTHHTVRRWIAEGRLRAYRVGSRALRVDADDAAALLDSMAIGG